MVLLLAADPFRGGGTAEAATAPPEVSSFEASFLVKAITQEFLAVSDILASPPLETAFLGGLISAAAAEASAVSVFGLGFCTRVVLSSRYLALCGPQPLR